MKMSIGHTILLCFIITCNFLRSTSQPTGENRNTEYEEAEPLVFLTVSSLASQREDRTLELNWENIPADEYGGSASIRLYNHDPREDVHGHLVSVRPTSNGYHRTSVRFPRPIFMSYNLTDDCLGFWIAYVRYSEIIVSSCIRARPHWMHRSRWAIGRASLLDLMLPGTHNAGSYAAFNPNEDNLFNKYLMTQEESIWNQLVYGVRYLDLRVSYQSASHRKSTERLWITHGHFRIDVPVKDVIRQVKQFLNATKEIVIMDFHRFVNGFRGRRTEARHRELIQMLQDELSEYMIPVHFTTGVPLNELWATDRRLYVGYAATKERRQHSNLFPAVRHLWGDVDKVDDLYEYLNDSVCNYRQRLTSAMAQLTPTAAGAIFNTYGGLREMANSVNRHVSKWFRHEWNTCANIVATDYFLGNDIIDIAIETNRRKFSGVS